MNVRPATRDDLAAIARLFAAHDSAVTGRPSHLDVTEVDGWLQTISFETNTWLFEEGGGLVAAAFGQRFGPLGSSAGAVHPAARGRGLGTKLLELVEARLREEGAERLHSWTIAGNDAAHELLQRKGFREARRFWEMEVDLADEPPEPAVAVETFGEDDAPAFHAALEEAFEDHWEYEPESFERWWPRQQARMNYDPSLWFVVRDGDEIAAAARNEIRESGGYVGSLGVRRPWRGRGFARALLLHSFREFRRRGLTRATLGVDAANPTGATRLYESVGMTVEREEIVWEKQLS